VAEDLVLPWELQGNDLVVDLDERSGGLDVLASSTMDVIDSKKDFPGFPATSATRAIGCKYPFPFHLEDGVIHTAPGHRLYGDTNNLPGYRQIVKGVDLSIASLGRVPFCAAYF